jgi:hypothetical protein
MTKKLGHQGVKPPPIVPNGGSGEISSFFLKFFVFLFCFFSSYQISASLFQGRGGFGTVCNNVSVRALLRGCQRQLSVGHVFFSFLFFFFKTSVDLFFFLNK